MDYLIGVRDDNKRERSDGCGFHAVAEMGWRADASRPVRPTVNAAVDAGGGLLIDWLRVNGAMARHVIPDSYRVHVPDPGYPPPMDHRLVILTGDLAEHLPAGAGRQPHWQNRKGSRTMTTSATHGAKVVVTGAAGFIGSHLVQGLLDRGFEVVGIDRRSAQSDVVARLNLREVLTNPRLSWIDGDLLHIDLKTLVKDAGCVFHLAAVPGVRSSWTGFEEYVAANILATERLLSACQSTGTPKLVYASSSSVYGLVNAPSGENDPTQPVSPYGVTKLAGEQLCLAYAKRPGSRLSVTALRYFTVYGPRQRPDMAIARILTAALTGEQYTIFGDGTQRREFTYVGDVVDATIAAAEVTVPAAVINVGGGSSVSMIDVIGMARQVTGNPVPLTAVNPHAGDVPATAADLTLARLLLGYQPHADLRTGMTRHAEWLRRLPPELLRTYAPPPATTEQEEPTCLK
jgi:nucleoside-diphosphate-sugar epimerase